MDDIVREAERDFDEEDFEETLGPLFEVGVRT